MSSSDIESTAGLVDVTMPQMGVSVVEGTVVEWRKRVGDAVQADAPICEVSTDKIDTEAPPPGEEPVAEPAPAERPAGEAAPPAGGLSRMRRTIGERMKRSLDTAATCTTWIEVDMSAVEVARERLGLSYLPFVARAAIG